MSSDDRLWNRDELFDEVWTTPMWTLAKKYGISDVGLAKVCRKLTIPLPGRGFWARKQAGQPVTKPPLPQVKEQVILRKPPPPKEVAEAQELGSAEERAQLERLDALSPDVMPKRGSLSHPLILQARAALIGAKPNDRGILWTSETCLDLRVSKASLDRAIRIIAALIGCMETEGFTISVGTGCREQTVVKVHGQEIKFGLIEKVDRIDQVAAASGSLVDRVLTYAGRPISYEPTGKLSLEVWNIWGSHTKRWKDGKSTKLEELVPRILAGFIRIALAERAKEEARAAEERERQLRLVAREQLESEIKAEQSKVRALRQLYADWSRAERLRSFLAAARDAGALHGESGDIGTPFGDWLAWAAQQADRLDPLKESPASIIDRRSELASEPVYWYGYHKPDPPFRFPKPIWSIKA